MKSAPEGASINLVQGALCGYIPSRVNINFGLQDGEKGLTILANDCDFSGNDIYNVHGNKKEDCGRSCIADSTCTHFTWLEDIGRCFLKSWGTGSDLIETNPVKGALCGWVKSRVNRR